MRLGRASGLALAVLVAGCAVGPNYERPAIETPELVRGDVGPAEAESLANLAWWDVFQDSLLRALVTEAIHNNYDLRTAAARVERARQFVGVARSDVFPQIGYEGEAARSRLPTGGQGNETENSFLGIFNLAWELDVWGRIRRATESAYAEYLATESFRRGVLLSLVSAVAQAYFELLELDRQLEIARETTATFQHTLDLFTSRFKGGIGTRLETSRGEAALAQAASTIPELEARIVAKENEISVLLGRNPGDIPRGIPLVTQALLPDIPVGLPSQLLERRPDVMEAEQAMVAANADIGVAVGNFLPRIGLTAFFGGADTDIERLVKHSGQVWGIAGSVSGPLFQGGRLLSIFRGSEAAWDEAVAQYLQTAISAFSEVSTTLVSHDKLKAVRVEKERQVNALQTAVDLSLERYNEGIATYYEVLQAQQELFPAQLTLARTQRDQLSTVVQLYAALGGGWGLALEEWAPEPTAEPVAQ